MTTLPITKVRIDGGTQPRASISEATVAEYADAMTENAVFPPLDVFFDGAEYWLADGFHRYHAARKLQLLSLPCEVHPGTRREAVLFSVGVNNKHGLPRTNVDKRKAVQTLLDDDEWRGRGHSWIGKMCGVSHTLVGDVARGVANRNKVDRASLVQCTSEEPKPVTYTTKHGTEAQMNTEKIGKAKTPAPLPSSVSSMAAAASVAIDGAGASSLRRFPKKAAADRVDSAVLALQGIGDVLRLVDSSDLSDHPRAAAWYRSISEVVGVLRSFNRNLSQAKTSEEVA